MLFCWPAGFILLWRSPKFSRKARMIITALVMLWPIGLVIASVSSMASLFGESTPPKKTPSELTVATAAATPSAAPTPSATTPPASTAFETGAVPDGMLGVWTSKDKTKHTDVTITPGSISGGIYFKITALKPNCTSATACTFKARLESRFQNGDVTGSLRLTGGALFIDVSGTVDPGSTHPMAASDFKAGVDEATGSFARAGGG